MGTRSGSATGRGGRSSALASAGSKRIAAASGRLSRGQSITYTRNGLEYRAKIEETRGGRRVINTYYRGNVVGTKRIVSASTIDNFVRDIYG